MILLSSRFEETTLVETRAFPARMADCVSKTVALLSRNQAISPAGVMAPVRVAEEFLHIPYRVYYEERQLLKLLDGRSDAGLVALCLGARHHNGVLREKCLRRLLERGAHWTAPFVIQLLGEYVLEVMQPIHERFMLAVEEKYTVFFGQNTGYCQGLEHRAISYWNAYYRKRFPSWKDYPGIQALLALRQAAGTIEPAGPGDFMGHAQ